MSNPRQSGFNSEGSDQFPRCTPSGRTEGFDEHQEWSAAECFRILHRRKSTLIYMVAAAIASAAAVSLAQPRQYRSEATIEIQGVNEHFLNTREVYPTIAAAADPAYVETQALNLQQDDLLKRVVKKLQLQERTEFQRTPGFWGRFGWQRLPPTPPDDIALQILRTRLRVTPVKNSRLVLIECESRDPRLAAEIANTLAQTFIDDSIEARQRAAQQTETALALQLKSLGDRQPRAEGQVPVTRTSPSSPRMQPFVAAKSRDRPLSFQEFEARVASSAYKRSNAADRRLYETLLERTNDARLLALVEQSNIRLAGAAQAPPSPHKPNVPLNMGVGAFSGLILAIGLVLFKEQTHRVLHNPGEAGLYLSIPELGAIPQVTHLVHHGPHDKLSGVASHSKTTAIEQQLCCLSESFRATLASLLSTAGSEHAHVFVITSAQPTEGKTTVVSNLGIALAEIGKDVLLIDGDMRRPRLHKLFNRTNSWGLSDVLREEGAIDLPINVLATNTGIPHLSLMPSGAYSDRIFGLLCSGSLARLITRLRKEFQYVLVDAPPCLEFADARIIARHADELILVIRANYTARQTAQAAVQRLVFDGIPVGGVILNRYVADAANGYLYGFNRPVTCRSDA